MSTKNIVFNIRTDEDTVNKFKSLSDKPNTTQGEFLKKLVEEYEKNLGFKEDIYNGHWKEKYFCRQW